MAKQKFRVEIPATIIVETEFELAVTAKMAAIFMMSQIMDGECTDSYGNIFSITSDAFAKNIGVCSLGLCDDE